MPVVNNKNKTTYCTTIVMFNFPQKKKERQIKLN